MPTWSMQSWRWAGLAAVLILASACGEPEALPPPGARGPIRLWRWDPQRADPVEMTAAGVRQVAGRPGSTEAVLDLEAVRLRVPFSGGLADVAAPSGRYAAGHDPEAELPAPTTPAAADSVADPAAPSSQASVAVVLALRHQIGIGRARRAWLAADGTGPYLENIEIVHAGVYAVHASAVVTSAGLTVTGAGRSRSAPVSVATALAALPADCLGETGVGSTVLGAEPVVLSAEPAVLGPRSEDVRPPIPVLSPQAPSASP